VKTVQDHGIQRYLLFPPKYDNCIPRLFIGVSAHQYNLIQYSAGSQQHENKELSSGSSLLLHFLKPVEMFHKWAPERSTRVKNRILPTWVLTGADHIDGGRRKPPSSPSDRTQKNMTQLTPEASAHPCLLQHYSQ
jgi:hypothetical protein